MNRIGEKHLLLVRNANSRIGKQQALENYINDPAVASAMFVFDNTDGSYSALTDVVCMQVKPGLGVQFVKDMAQRFGYTAIRQNEHDADQYYITLPSRSLGSLYVANALYETGGFVFAEPNFICVRKPQSDSSCAPGLNDTYFNEQWGLYNDGGSTYYQTGFRWSDINVCHAWPVTMGSSSIKVAVMDDGVDMGHADISGGSSATGWTIPSPPAYPTIGAYPGAPSNFDVHGTACAGIIRAQANNSQGIAGVAPGTTLIPVRWAYYTPALGGWFSSFSDWEDAFDWCTYTAQADVLSASWGGTTGSSIVDNAIHRAVTDGRGSRGCVIVVSTGNFNNSNIQWPSANSETIAVGGMSMCDERKNPGSCDGEMLGGQLRHRAAVSVQMSFRL